MILDVEQELHVPAEVLDALGELARHLERQPGLGGAVDAEAAHAAVGQIAQGAVGDVLADQRDGAEPAGVRLDGVDDEAVVGAVQAGLHHHAALEARGGEHGEIIVEHHRRRRVETVGGPGIFVARPEHMAVAVGGFRRQLQFRRAHVEMRAGALWRVQVHRGVCDSASGIPPRLGRVAARSEAELESGLSRMQRVTPPGRSLRCVHPPPAGRDKKAKGPVVRPGLCIS